MAQQQNQDTPAVGFRSIRLLKSQTLGIGSYGSVCKAKCDNLLCAAKIIHPTLYDPTAQEQIAGHREHRLPFRRFQQECEFMSAIKHPNIVQYLGTHQDPETGLPVLLMELMDDSLTHFLESSQDPVPYHIQVNFCYDINLAIFYLHINGIIHRDLSSNNVLLYANVKAKVTDFGMAKLGDANPQATRISLTMVPGTDAYMPPEAVKEQPVYTAKIDCFAIGALIIQILTRQFPKPGERLKSVQIDHPQFPGGSVDVRVPEIERRRNHISQVDPSHPLLPIALQCLKDSDVERPSAQELCHSVVALKETPQYTESVRMAQERRSGQDNTAVRVEQIRELQQQIQQKDSENHELRQQHARQIQGFQQIIGSQNNHLQEKDVIIREKEQTISEKQKECQKLRETIRDKDRELQRLAQELSTSQQVKAQFQTRIQELEKQPLKTKSPTEVLAKPQSSLQELTQTHDPPRSEARNSLRTTIWEGNIVTFREVEMAPYFMRSSKGADAVVNDNIVYCRPLLESFIYAYNSTDKKWDSLPVCPNEGSALAIVNNLLTTIGGTKSTSYTDVTNLIFSFTGEGKRGQWKRMLPPMPTKRRGPTAVCTKQALIVAGGQNESQDPLKKVEIMHIDNQQWSTAADLPGPLYSASGMICGDRIYMLGGSNNKHKPSKSVYTCPLADLLTRPKNTRWSKAADLPVIETSCVAYHGHLLAIGGRITHLFGNYENEPPTSNVYAYNRKSNKWELFSHLITSRYGCFAAVCLNDEVMVVGGYTKPGWSDKTNSMEIGTLSYKPLFL